MLLIKKLANVFVAVFVVSALSLSCAKAEQNRSKASSNDTKMDLTKLSPDRPLEINVPAKEVRADAGFKDGVDEQIIPLILFAGATGSAFAKGSSNQNYYQRVEYKNYVIIVNGSGVAYDAGKEVREEYKVPGDVTLQLRMVQLSEVIEEDINFKELNVSLNLKGSIINYLLEVSCINESVDCGLTEELALEIVPLLYRAN